MFDIPTKNLNKGKVVLVTGGSTGIGFETVRTFAKAGYTVITTTRHPESAMELQALAKEYPGQISIKALDFAPEKGKELDFTEVKERIIRFARDVGKVDILINNVGAGLLGPIHATTDEELATIYNVNVLGPMALTRRVLDQMIASKSPCAIVWVNSIVGPMVDSKQSAYSSTKGASTHIALGMRLDLEKAGHPITVCSVNPGPVLTEFKNSAPSGSRFAANDTPYPQTARELEEWRAAMDKGEKPESVAQIIFRVAHESDPDPWNPTTAPVRAEFERAYKDPTGRSMMAILALAPVSNRIGTPSAKL